MAGRVQGTSYKNEQMADQFPKPVFPKYVSNHDWRHQVLERCEGASSESLHIKRISGEEQQSFFIVSTVEMTKRRS